LPIPCFYVFGFFFFCGNGVWTLGLMLARQALLLLKTFHQPPYLDFSPVELQWRKIPSLELPLVLIWTPDRDLGTKLTI
jgi:hypothetical protein